MPLWFSNSNVSSSVNVTPISILFLFFALAGQQSWHSLQANMLLWASLSSHSGNSGNSHIYVKHLSVLIRWRLESIAPVGQAVTHASQPLHIFMRLIGNHSASSQGKSEIYVYYLKITAKPVVIANIVAPIHAQTTVDR